MDVTFYDNLDDMFDDLARSMKAADARVKDWQAAIPVGAKFRQSTEYGFNIYGEILQTHRESHLRHYRLCFAFSEACPEGEMGDVHVSVISELISDEVYADLVKLFDARRPNGRNR